MIDLSFLTEEEQVTILAVLQRDADLKKAEAERIKNLQRTVRDKGQLKYLTGEWFYETKSLRHQDRIHGADILRASMKQKPKPKPLTILELSQMWPEKPSFVASDNRNVFIPPELSGLILDPQMNQRDPNPHETHKCILQSPTKQRQNPFDSEPFTTHPAEEKDRQVAGGEPFPSPDCTFLATNAKQHDANGGQVDKNAPAAMPVPKKRRVTNKPQDSHAELDSPADLQANSAAPRGILKNISNSSSMESVSPSWVAAQSPIALDSPPESPPAGDKDPLDWLDRKQVRFCSAVGRSSKEWQDGKELWEHGLLDVDFVSPTEDNGTHANSNHNTTADTRRPLIKQTEVDVDVGSLCCETEANLHKQDTDPQHISGDQYEHCHAELLSPQVSDRSAEQESGKPFHREARPEEEVHSNAKATDWLDCSRVEGNKPLPKLPKQSSDALAIFVEAASDTKISNAISSQNPFHAVSPKLLGIFSRGEAQEKRIESPDKEDILSKQKELGDDGQSAANVTNSPGVEQDPNHPGKTEVRTLQLTALKHTPFKDRTSSFLDSQQDPTEHNDNVATSPKSGEEGNGSPTMIFTRNQTTHENIPKTETDTSHDPRNFHIAEKSLGKGRPAENSLLFESTKKDGTYKACPVLIYEETDNSIAGSLTHSPVAPQECITPPKLVSHGDSPLSIMGQRSLQDNQSARIRDHKCFWETEYSGPSAMVGKPKETSVSPTQSHSSSGSLGSTEKTVEEPQCSSSKFNIEQRAVTQSVDQSQSRSHGPAGNVESSSQQLKTKIEAILPRERSLSPSRSLTPRSKDSSDDELKRSPSKTCHPKALTRESPSSKRSRLQESPFKTFPIDIAPLLKHREESVRPTPVSRKGPSREAKQSGLTDIKPKDCDGDHLTLSWKPSEHSPQISQALTQPGNSKPQNDSPLGKGDSDDQEKFTHLARSFIPQDSRHYLGAPKKAYLPLFDQDVTAAESNVNSLVASSVLDADHSPQRIADNVDDDPSRDQTTKSWSKTWASSGNNLPLVQIKSTVSMQSPLQQAVIPCGFDDESTPLGGALKRISSRPMSLSKSLENLTSQTPREEKSKTSPTGQLSVDDDPERMKRMSTSVPVFQEKEIDSDGTSDINMGRRRNTVSSTSISLSSGMASMLSVSGSVSSLYPADFGNIEVQGSIQFAVNYVQKLVEFHIFVVHCRDLAVADSKKSRSDPYVKCYLLPDQTKLGKRKTSVKKKTLNPTYNEILRFKIPMETLKTQKLNVSVWHNDTFGRNSFLGEVDLDLSEWDFSNTQINDYFLKSRLSALTSTPSASRSNSVDMRGQMRVALRFLPQISHSKRTSKMENGEVQIWVKDCKNLPPVRGLIIDPFVKCTVLPDTSRKVRQKTRVVKRTANPMFNHTMVYNGFRPEDLREVCAEITVWDHDRLNNHYIGGLRIGPGTGKSYGAEVAWMDSTTEEANLWERMMQSNGDWVEGVLPLRMLVLAKSISK